MMIAHPPVAFTRRSCWLVVIAQAVIGAFTALWAGHAGIDPGVGFRRYPTACPPLALQALQHTAAMGGTRSGWPEPPGATV